MAPKTFFFSVIFTKTVVAILVFSCIFCVCVGDAAGGTAGGKKTYGRKVWPIISSVVFVLCTSDTLNDNPKSL